MEMVVIVVMEFPINGKMHRLDPGQVIAAFFSRTGIARLARHWRPSDACVLTFHGVSNGSDNHQLLDLDQHVCIDLFTELCDHLKACYSVRPLSEIMEARQKGLSLPQNTVAITFDDGYSSNYLLAYPVLKERGLPATIFTAAGYLDGKVTMWFHRIELAFARTQVPHLDYILDGQTVRLPLTNREERSYALGRITYSLKRRPTSELLEALAKIESDLGVADIVGKDLPPTLQPMTWDAAREMRASGVIEFGGHTFSHPILARCTDDQQADEIRLSRERLAEEFGTAPKLFAYTNGKHGDFNATTQRLLKENGFEAAFTMLEAFLFDSDNEMALPRYGCPSSTDHLEALVSGSMAHFESLRKKLGLVRAA
jgi:peptidoglycan/xylan/chitin deacetylase (PgdA/CDA1 family)